MSKPSLTIVELNEFNVDLLRSAAVHFDLPHIEEILSWQHSITSTEDKVEFQGLDPWVQWVNIHTGQPSGQHGVIRLGDTTRASNRPFWLQLCREEGISWGAWGVMNTPLVDSANCDFFFPDPWSFKESAFPGSMNSLLALPRYLSQNYMQIAPLRVVRDGWTLARGLAGHWKATRRFLGTALPALLSGHINAHTASTLFDYLGFCLWLELCGKHDTDVRIIFLNSLAHLQHHVWHHDGTEWDSEMKLGLEFIDKMLGEILVSQHEADRIVILNGLSQRNVAGQDIHIYRQIEPSSLLVWLDCQYVSVEPCMTDEVNVLFASSEDADRAERLIGHCRLSDGTRAFVTDRLSSTQLFYQIDFHHRLSGDARLWLDRRSIDLSSLIDVHAVRTGEHVPQGDVFARNVELPAHMQNHELAELLTANMRASKSAVTA